MSDQEQGTTATPSPEQGKPSTFKRVLKELVVILALAYIGYLGYQKYHTPDAPIVPVVDTTAIAKPVVDSASIKKLVADSAKVAADTTKPVAPKVVDSKKH